MIKQKTVFILGAGASMPYNFPSGAQLRTLICAATTQPQQTTLGQWLIKGMAEATALIAFAQAFSRSNVISIDAFLDKRREFLDIGKMAIAAVLTEIERKQRYMVFSDSLDDHWYRLLWNAMIFGAQRHEDVRFNQVRFVTFNYDRSLEYFFHESAKHAFGIDDAAGLQFVNNLNILHVYGLLGKYAITTEGDGRAYGEQRSEAELKIAAGGIQLIPEARGDEVFLKAREWFSWADRICFLGFGFDPLNIERLNLASVLQYKYENRQNIPGVFASTLGRTKAEVLADLKRCLGGVGSWSERDLNNSMTLRTLNLLTPD